MKITSDIFFDIFPFIIVFNRGMRIRFVGKQRFDQCIPPTLRTVFFFPFDSPSQLIPVVFGIPSGFQFVQSFQSSWNGMVWGDTKQINCRQKCVLFVWAATSLFFFLMHFIKHSILCRNIGIGLLRVMAGIVGKKINQTFLLMRPFIRFRWEEVRGTVKT